jgi:hypothetical protein
LSFASAQGAEDERPKQTGVATRRKAGSSVEITPYANGSFVVRSVNRTYDFITSDHGQHGLLLSQEIETKGARPPGEGWDVALVRVTAQDVSPAGNLQQRYEIVASGQRGRLLDRFRYQVISYGGCDSLDGFVVYSVWTGKPIVYTSGWDGADSLVQLKTSDSGADRWIGVYTSNAPYDEVVFGSVQGTRAVITYADAGAPLARALIDFGPLVTAPHQVDRLEIKPGPLVHVALVGEVAIEIPIKDDKLDIGRAKLPGGATAQLLPTAWPDKPRKQKK